MITELAFLQRYRTWALWALAVIVVLATVAGQVESFHGLFEWFGSHGLPGVWAAIAPLMVDSFTLIGELAIFASLTGHWGTSKRVLPWLSVLLGLGASIAGNVGDKAGHAVSWQLTAAIPPLAAAFGIVIGFSVLKSLAAEVSMRSLVPGDTTVTAEVVPETESLMVSPEGMRELEEETRTVKTAPLEAPKPKGLDVLIPRRELVVEDPVPVDSVESGMTPLEVSQDFARDRSPGRYGVVGQTGSFQALP